MQHPFETRLAIVQRVKAGTPIHRLWRELGIKERTILEWVRRYDRAGGPGGGPGPPPGPPARSASRWRGGTSKKAYLCWRSRGRPG